MSKRNLGIFILATLTGLTLATYGGFQLLFPLRRDPQGIDLLKVPGPWENHQISLQDESGQSMLNVHYLAAGPSGAPVVILLHGFPDTSYGWRYVIPLLSKDYRVLAPDLRGYAGTDKPTIGYDLGTLAEDLNQFIVGVARLEGRKSTEPVHLLAHDWGASIAWRAATDTPERFLSLTVLDIPHPLAFFEQYQASEKQREYRWFVAELIAPWSARALAGLSVSQRSQLFYLNELHRASALTEFDSRYYQAVFNTPEKLRGPLRYYDGIFFKSDEITKYYSSAGPVRVPTLVLWGKLDSKMMPEMAAMSCGHVSSSCEHEVFAESGHYLHWELPDQVVNRWRTRFSEIGKR